MKIDIKTILILVFLLTTLIFGYKWFFTDNKAAKEKIKELEAEYKELEAQKKTVDLEIAMWKNKLDSLQKVDATLKLEIERLESIIKKAEQDSQKAKADLDKLRKEIAETKKQIEYLKNNPPNRTGDDLIESLKSKLK